MSKAEQTQAAAEFAKSLIKKGANVPYEGEKDTPASITISLPKSMIRELEARRLSNKDTAAGPKTISGLIKAALEKDGYGVL
jgi:hypothetical protein